jgi:predicted DNA binding CopG/RHH family protein
MPDPVSNESSGNAVDFASMLKALTGASKEPDESWDMSALGEDVAAISYEQALRTHRRTRTEEPGAQSIEPHSPASIAPTEAKKIRKTASVTMRLTTNENAQLQERAADAGLSVSAYLRSCIFEAESLRAQVKEAVSHMREVAAHEPNISNEKQSASGEQRGFRFFPRWRHRQRG